MESENPVWLGEYVWEESSLDGGPPKSGPLPAEVLGMFRPQHCLLCGITTANMQTAYTHYESKGHFKKVTHHMREKFNVLGCLKANKEKFRTVKCDICNVEITSRIVYLQHYDGKQHLKNMKKRGFKTPAAGEVATGDSAPNPSVSDPDGGALPPPPPPPLPKVGDYVCALCNVTTTTRSQMQTHNTGSRHMKNVAKLADGELMDFYIKNGNCEPMEKDEMEGSAKTAKDSSFSDQPPGQTHRPTNPQLPGKMPQSDQSHGDYNEGYGPAAPPMDPSMMQQFPPQMPFGQYPQYPMPYDYNSWGQSNMYPGYNNAPPPYNGQYGAGPYGPAPQQYPPFGYPQGPPPDFYKQQQQQQQQFNPGQQEFNPGQQPLNQGPHQYNQGPHQFHPDQQQQYTPGQQNYDYHNSANSHQQNQSNFGGDQRPNPSPKDPRRHSRNREPPTEPKVNETPLPEGVHLKPLAVLPFIRHMAEDSSDGPPGVDGPPGIDKHEAEYSNPPVPSFNDSVEDEDKKLTSNAKVEPKSPPRTLLDLIRENAKKSKRAKEDDEKATASQEDAPSTEVVTDLPPIPGLDFAPIEGKPPIITWSEGNKEEGEPDSKDDSAPRNDISYGSVVPPPPHPLNPPIHFLPESPESEPPPSNEKLSPKPETSFSQPEVSSLSSTPSYTQPQVSSENSTQSYSQPKLPTLNSNTPHSQSQVPGNLQPHYSHLPVPSSNAAYSQPPMANPQSAYPQMPSAHPQSYPQAPVNPQPTYSNYNAPYISNLPVSYSQAPPNYPPMYTQIPAENPQPYPQVPSTPSQMPLPQPIPQPLQSSLPLTPPPIPPLLTKPELDPTVSGPAQSSTQQSADDKTANFTKGDDSTKSAASKPKINSFFRRAAERMFKEAKEKKMKEEAKKIEDSSIDPEPVNKEPGKDAIVIVPPSSGPKPEKATADISAAASTHDLSKAFAAVNTGNLSKVHPPESVAETDNDIVSEPGEIIDKKPQTQKIIEKADLTVTSMEAEIAKFLTTETETPKSLTVASTEAETPKSLTTGVEAETPKSLTVTSTEAENPKSLTVTSTEAENPKSLTVTSTEAETPKSEKSKFDFGSKKSSENRRKRSFRVRRSSVSRSRSRSRSPKRRGRRRSRSWSPSPEKSPVGYYQRNNFQSYYGNDTRYWRNDNKVQYRSYEDWDGGYNNDRYDRRRNTRDEFGRERKWKEEKKKEERKKKKRKSRKRSRSSSESPPPRKASKERKAPETKKKVPSPSPPIIAKPVRPKLPDADVSVDPKPVTVSLMQRLKGSLPTTLEKPLELFPKKEVPAKLVEEVKNTVEVRDVVIRPDVDSDEDREVEKEEQEILKKVALIKKKLLEKEDEKPVKIKKRKKEKMKHRKKKKRSSSSSDSDSSTSDSSSSSSSSSSATSSSSSTSAGSEPKSKRIVESLLTKLSRQAAVGDKPPFDLSMLPGLVKKSKKSEGSKKKKKKDKKRKKKKKKDKKVVPEPPVHVLSAFITPEGAYHCKCCNLTTSAGSAFLEHLISEKHKLMCKLISTAK